MKPLRQSNGTMNRISIVLSTCAGILTAAIRASRSDCVVQVMLVPGALVEGREAQLGRRDMSHFTLNMGYTRLHGRRSTGLENKFATNTLGKLLVHTGVLTRGTRTVGREGGKLRARVAVSGLSRHWDKERTSAQWQPGRWQGRKKHDGRNEQGAQRQPQRVQG